MITRRDTCPHCGRTVATTRTGLLRAHRPEPGLARRCHGSGDPAPTWPTDWAATYRGRSVLTAHTIGDLL